MIHDRFFSTLTGRGVRVAVIDSGVNPAHPHVGAVAGGVAIAADGTEQAQYVDRLGHGTAVAAAIREKAPAAEIYAVKVFDRVLSTDVNLLVAGVDWALRQGIRLLNLSLGTARPEHETVLRDAVARASAQRATIVAARELGRAQWLPGALPGVVPVGLDWECPRPECRADVGPGGEVVLRASGYPRPIPGVDPEGNLKGISFAVANATGLLARALEAHPDASGDELARLLAGS